MKNWTKARNPKAIIRFLELSKLGSKAVNFIKSVHANRVMAVDEAIAPALKRIMKLAKSAPLYLRYKQFENISTVAMKIASLPPKRRKVRKIVESEKLITKFGRSKFTLRREATVRVNIAKAINRKSKTS